jgi:hypothetical protein
MKSSVTLRAPGPACRTESSPPHRGELWPQRRRRLSLLADDMEAAQLDSGEQVLVGARAVLADAKAGERAVRFALTRAVESLADALRVAVSRGHRIPEREDGGSLTRASGR